MTSLSGEPCGRLPPFFFVRAHQFCLHIWAMVRVMENPKYVAPEDVVTRGRGRQGCLGLRLFWADTDWSLGKMRTGWCHLSHFVGARSISQAHLECVTVCFKVIFGMYFAMWEFEKWEPRSVGLNRRERYWLKQYRESVWDPFWASWMG